MKNVFLRTLWDNIQCSKCKLKLTLSYMLYAGINITVSIFNTEEILINPILTMLYNKQST